MPETVESDEWSALFFRQILRELVDGWVDQSRGSFVRKGSRRKVTEAQFATVYGLCAHAHRVAMSLDQLLTPELPNTGIALVRAVYECGITAQWVAQVPDGAEAFVNESNRQRRGLRDAMAMTPNGIFQSAALRIAVDMEEHPSPSNTRTFKTMCLDLDPGGLEAYVYYRLLSEMSHASAAVTDLYVRLDEDATSPPRIRLAPGSNSEASDLMLHLACSSLIWAARALDYFEQGHSRRSELRQMARRLHIRSDLQLSPAYYERVRKQRR